MDGVFMSVEINDGSIIISDQDTGNIIVDLFLWDENKKLNVNNSDYERDLTKPELAQLIAALQAMHDRMEE
jgi:hypothetical protein